MQLCWVHLTLQQAQERDVDLIALGPRQSCSSQSEIRRILAAREGGRLPVVSTEGADSSPTDWGSVPEACEIGGLGTLDLEVLDSPARKGGCPALPSRRDDLIGR